MPTRVLLVALGSSGDVHPLVGLGAALRERGHEVTLATNPYFEQLVRRVGLEFAPVGTEEELRRAMENPDLWHPRRGFNLMVKQLLLPFLRPLYDLAVAHHERGGVVAAPATALGVRVAQEKVGVRLATIHLQPSMLRSVHQSPVLGPLLLGDGVPRSLKRLQFWLADRLLIDPRIGPGMNSFRAEVGLPPVKQIMADWWQSTQRVIGLFPDWFGPPQPDWPKQTRLTGFPLWDERSVTTIPPEVGAFLSAGELPIVFTPGSAMLHGQDFFQAAVEACQSLSRRGILLTRYPEQLPAHLPAWVRHFGFVPLSSLLPRAAAIVHHGGVGTLAQGLAAGIPQLVMPMAHDQPDNAARLIRLGVGAALEPKLFTAANVAERLASLLDSSKVQTRCRELAARFDTPAALAQTCELIEGLASVAAAPAARR